MKNIYIVLSQTGTLFSKAIRLYTKDPYNHSSLSFDSSLKVMYSFGRRKRFNMLDSGFIEENFYQGLFPYFPNANCCILEIPVTEAEFEAMYSKVKFFCRNPYLYRYNLVGVLGYMAGVTIIRQEHYFCSQFISYVLQETDFWRLQPEFTRPMDFFSIPNKRLIFEGGIKEFIELYWQSPALV